MATHLAYLQEMDVDLSLPLQRIQEDIVGKFLSCLDGSISISNAKEILSVLGKLVTHSQCCDLITKNIEVIYLTQVVNNNLAVLISRMQWELERQNHFLTIN